MAKKEEINYSALKQMWDWLCSKYEFRRDVIKGRILWRDALKPGKPNDKDFEVLTDEKLNTISIEAGFSGLKSSTASNITLFLFSHYTEEINPVADYLKRVAKRRPVDAIKKLCGYIQTHDNKMFEKHLRKWLASSIANALIPKGCQNHTCLTLTGGQGAGKTTLFKWFCPPELSDYMYNGEIDLRSKDTLWKLAEYWIINLEEQIKSLNRQDSNTMKQIITLPDVKGRKPYGRLEAIGYRLANFLAGSNDDDFLNDPTGSRRFPSFKVVKIDEAYNKMKIDDIWAEAYHYYEQNPTSYYVTAEDFDELQKNNEQFVHVTQEAEYISNFIAHPKENMPYYLLPATALRDYMRFETGNQGLKERAIGIALKTNGFEQLSHRFTGADIPAKVWKVRVIAGKNIGTLDKYHAFANNQYKP